MGRGDVADGTPDNGCHALAEEGDGHDRDDGVEGIEVIGAHNGHRAEEAADDGQFAGLGEGTAAEQHRIEPLTAQKDADEGSDIGNDGVNPGFQQGQVLGHDQVRRKPGQKEEHRTRIGKLAQVNAQELAVFEELRDLGQGYLLFFRCLTAEAAAFADISQFRFVGAGIGAGVTIEEIPEETGYDTDETGDIEDFPPAIIFQDPEQYRRQEGQADEFTGRINRRRRSPFVRGKPGGDDAAVCRESRCFSGTDGQTDAKEGGKRTTDAHEHSEQGPEEQRRCISDTRAEAFDKPAAGNLHKSVRPGKCREQQPHRGGVEIEFLTHAGRGDGHIRPVQVVDGREDK